METMVISCPECGTKMKVPESTFGKKVRCKKCEQVFPVRPPRKAAAVEDDEEEPKPAPPRAVKSAKDVKPPPPKPGKGDKPAPPKPPPPPAKPTTVPGEDAEDDGKAYGVTDDKLGYRCPQCASEMPSEDAKICLNCGFNTLTRAQARTRRVKETTGGDKFLWLLPGILSVLAILLMIGYWFFHHYALPDMVVDRWDDMLTIAKDDRRAALDDENMPWHSMFFRPWFELWMGISFGFLSFFAVKFAVKRLILHPNPPEVEFH